jgi:hypothetical protein
VGENTPDEVLETVREVDQLAEGISVPTDQRLLEDWQRSLTIPAFYGASLPSQYFLEKNKMEILKTD